MGLDMYLNKTKRVEDLKSEEYGVFDDYDLKKIKGKNGNGILKKDTNFKPKMIELIDAIHEEGSSYKYLTIFHQIGYWRKANQIHNWFVENTQNGIDECQLTEVSAEQLQKLLEVCKNILNSEGEKRKVLISETLPTQGGFFFGGTEIDEWYFRDVEETVLILEKVLDETDFEKEIVFYRSSW